MRRDLTLGGDHVLHAAADRGEITPDENSPFDDDDNQRPLDPLVATGGRGFHRDSQFFSVAQGLAAATNDATMAVTELEPDNLLLFAPNRDCSIGREVLARQYLGELHARRS